MKFIISLFAFSSIIFFAAAQPGKNPQQKREQIEVLKISFITQRLNLTKEEAQKFWQVYNEYHDALKTHRAQHAEQAGKKRQDLDALSEKELLDLIDSQIIYRQQKLDIQKKYHAEFKSVLPLKKVALLYQAEDDFRRHVFKEAQNRIH